MRTDLVARNSAAPTATSRHLSALSSPAMRARIELTHRLRDARIWQILSLSLLLAFGMVQLGFDQKPAAIPLIFAGALGTQWLMGRAFGLPCFDPLSPLITALSLSILLRADEPVVLGLAGSAAIASKFLIRLDGKHVFNPANFAIAGLLLATDTVWISPAQWGSRTWAAFLFASLAILVLSRARRADIALAFLAAYIALLFARALWLGDPLAIPLKQMQSGAILLFAFFMISDPKTTPDRRGLRVLFAVLVAATAHVLQFQFWNPNGLMVALFFLSPLVPLLDRWQPITRTDRFQWAHPTI